MRAFARCVLGSCGQELIYSCVRIGLDGGLYRKLRIQFQKPPQYFGMMIGTSDIFYMENKSFDRSLTRKGYGHEFIVTDGGHKWTNWRKYLIGFYQTVFKD